MIDFKLTGPIGHRTRPVIGAAFAALLLGGCGMSSLTSGIGGGLFGGGAAGKPETAQSNGVSADALLTAAKADGPSGTGADAAPGCPRFSVWSREGQVTIYETGRVGDGLAVMHRGEITKTARECSIAGNRVTVKFGFSGRVLLGPRGKSGTVALPLNVFVADAKRERIATDKVRIEVPIALDKPIGYFSTVKEISFTVPEGARAGEYEVFVGFERNIPGAG